MRFFSIHGEKNAKSLQREVDDNYEQFWRPALELIKLGYLSYTEAIEIDEDNLYKLWYAATKIERNIKESR